jgi:rubrerythrin
VLPTKGEKMKIAIRFAAVAAVVAVVVSAGWAAVPTKTIKNLKAAFAGETTAFSKYTQYAKKAETEGQVYAASLFRAAARSEGYHARNHRKVLDTLGISVSPAKYDGKVGTTSANLADAKKGESFERDTMYPGYIATAKAEGATDAVRSFTYALGAEKEHARFYTAALKDLQGSAKPAAAVFYVCPVCGQTFKTSAPASCPICTTSRTRFVKLG